MFKPSSQVRCCPICGAPLEYKTLDQFDVPIGYSLQCNDCCQYSDIWVNGLREVQCGDWFSPDYDSEYGAMTAKDQWRERWILLALNVHLLKEHLQYAGIHRHDDMPTQTKIPA